MFFWALLVAALVGWSSWALVIDRLSPFLSPEWALSLFYASFFVALASTFSLIFHLVQKKGETGPGSSRSMASALRRGILAAFLLCVAAAFQRLRVLTWWNGGLLFLVGLLVELYFSGREG